MHGISSFKTILASVCLLTATAAAAQARIPADTTRLSFSNRFRTEISFTGRGAYVLQTCALVRGDNFYGSIVNIAHSFDLRYTFRMPAGSKFDKLYPHAYQGLGVGVTDFSSNKVTGTPVSVYVLQGSRIAPLSQRLSLDYEWNFGASFGWHKISNWYPGSYFDIDGFGSHTNAYINLDFLLRYRLSKRLTLSGGVGLSHYSNGNTDYPNPGINALWLRLGLAYKIGSHHAAASKADWSGFEAGMVYDLTAYGAWHKSTFSSGSNAGGSSSEHLVPGHFAVAGLTFNPLYRFNPVIAAGLSLDAQYDDGANLSAHFEPNTPVENPRFYRQPFRERMTIGISARAELTMPIFSVNIGVGHSIYAPGGHDLRGWYQTFTLKTFICRNLYLSTGYRLVRFHIPGNLMLGLGYSFGR